MIRRPNCTLLLTSLCLACSGSTSSPTATRKPEAPISTQIQAPASPITQSSAAPIAGYKAIILRRLSILLTQKLPTVTAISRYQAGTDSLSSLMNAALSASAPGIAEEHRFVWNLLRAPTPDLDRFALSDTTLSAQLTPDLRWQISESPMQELRYLLEQSTSFDTFLSRGTTLEATSALSIWGTTGTTTPWPAESYQKADLPNVLGATGFFSSHSFAATLNSEERTVPYAAFAETWRRLLCQNFTTPNTHDYSQIEKPLTQNWRNLATSTTACAGCHNQYQSAADTLSRQHTGTNLTEWLTVHDAASASGSYAGGAYTDTASLMTLFQQDPRAHLCELQNLLSIVLQKPFTASEQPLLARMGSLSLQKNHQLSAALQELFLSQAWNPYLQRNIVSSTDLPETTTPALIPSIPRVHVLTRAQLVGILAQLGVSQVSIPYTLNPGSDETETRPHYTPSSTYFYYLDRMMRLAADEIIANELSDTSVSSTRTLFTLLPDGSGVTPDDAVIATQLVQLWTQLTAQPILVTDAAYTHIKTLWSTGFAAKTADPDATRSAWRLVLIGILLSTEFITY